MEVQTQMTPTPQAPLKQNKAFILIIAIALGVSIMILYAYFNFNAKQLKMSEEVISRFSVHLEKEEYSEAYQVLQGLEVQDLGSHLQETRASLDQQLASKMEEVVSQIMIEKGQEYTTYNKYKGLAQFSNYPAFQEALKLQLTKKSKEYLTDKIEYSQIEYFFQNMLAFDISGSVLEESRVIVEQYREARENINKGQEFFAVRDYVNALEKFSLVSAENQEAYEMAQIGTKQTLSYFFTQVDRMSRLGQYQQASEKLQQIKTILPENQEITRRIEALELARQEEEKNLIPYNGPVQHIFFHPLIAYPELTFDGDLQANGFNEWFVTIPEFEKIIQSLYSKGFILVNISDLYEVTGEGEKETIKPKQLYLPKGKRPMVISIDDLNYYRYMVQNGMVYKLIVDDNGKIATYSKNPKGEDIVAYNNEIVPILDSFVEEHPDFSFHGAKGIIALTGYEGILGYRTDEPDSPDFEKEKKEALQVVQVLKDTGWSFASHSQGHLNVREDTYERLVRDTQRWKKEVESLIGQTEVYIYPFGAAVKPEDPKFKFLQEAGFKVFCAVGPNPVLKYSEQYVLMDRRHIDGIALFNQANSLRDLFDSEAVIDPVRPPLKD